MEGNPTIEEADKIADLAIIAFKKTGFVMMGVIGVRPHAKET